MARGHKQPYGGSCRERGKGRGDIEQRDIFHRAGRDLVLGGEHMTQGAHDVFIELYTRNGYGFIN